MNRYAFLPPFFLFFFFFPVCSFDSTKGWGDSNDKNGGWRFYISLIE